MTEKNVNYSAELTATIVEAYEAAESDEARKQVVIAMANEHGKSTKSVIQKLVRESVYRKPAYVSKAGATVERKSDIVQGIAKILNVTEAQLGGLDKATKPALETIRAGFVAAAAALAFALGDPENEAEQGEDSESA